MNELMRLIILHTDQGLSHGVEMPEEIRQELVQMGIEAVATGTWMISISDENEDLIPLRHQTSNN